MNCKIETTPDFARELKQLAKRYPSMKDDYRDFLDTLRKSPLQGEPLGKHLRKVRFPIASKAKGKSGGARGITHTVLVESDGANITLVTIYDKSDQANITDKELKKLIKKTDWINNQVRHFPIILSAATTYVVPADFVCVSNRNLPNLCRFLEKKVKICTSIRFF